MGFHYKRPNFILRNRQADSEKWMCGGPPGLVLQAEKISSGALIFMETPMFLENRTPRIRRLLFLKFSSEGGPPCPPMYFHASIMAGRDARPPKMRWESGMLHRPFILFYNEELARV